MLFRSGHTPPRAGRTPPRGPPAAAAARRPPPPSTPRRGQSPFPAPPTLTHPGAAGPAGPRPLAPAHRGGGGPYPHPRSRAPFPPHHHRGRREGAPTGSWAPSGQGHTSEARERRKEGGRAGQTAAGGVVGVGDGERETAPRLGRRGEAPGDRRGRPRAADDRRPAEAGRPRAGGGRRRGKAGGPATGSRHPSRRTARQTRPEDPRRAVRGR